MSPGQSGRPQRRSERPESRGLLRVCFLARPGAAAESFPPVKNPVVRLVLPPNCRLDLGNRGGEGLVEVT